MASRDLPYFCPRCGDRARFASVPDLRSHLVSQHTYETLLVLSRARARSSGPRALLPHLGRRERPILGPDPQRLPLPLACLDLAASSASAQLLREVFTREDWDPGCSSSTVASLLDPQAPSCSLALLGPLEPLPGHSLKLGELGPISLGLEFGLGPPGLSLGLEERLGLGLERRAARTFAEVEERVERRVGRLRAELGQREAELERERRDGERLGREKEEVEERAAYLGRQVQISVEMMADLRRELEGTERQLDRTQQEMSELESYLRETAEREAGAKARLQVFIEALLERADRAERQLTLLNTHAHHDAHTHNTDTHNTHGSVDNISGSKLMTYRRSYSVSLGEQVYPHHYSTPSGRQRTLSLGSGAWGIEGGWPPLETPHYQRPWQGGEVGQRRHGGGRTWRKGSHRHHSTEEEEEEEEEDSLLEGNAWSTPEIQRRTSLRNTHTPDTDASSGNSTPRYRGNRALEAVTLRLRAGLFCVFPYLDARTLLRAAEVCSDWRFVARHPAVWTRLRLEDARVSSQFLSTLSQWSSQTQSLVLQNLRPRPRHRGESREDYHKNTRGCLEGGLEALLRASGGSLLILRVSHCPHILTDRSLWLASCYSRNLHTLTYRSSSDPMGEEVVWALGAGCRNITHLQVAPLHPCQQPTRLSNRCLQTIGRCWPHLRVLGVGGAGCGVQGLAAIARSCVHLQALELERVTGLDQQGAVEQCSREGLQSLESLLLSSCPVTAETLLHLHRVCVNLRSMVVQVSVSDYCEEPVSPETQRQYEDVVSSLQALQQRPGVCDVFQLKAEGFC